MKQAYRHIYSLFKERRKEKETEERVKKKKKLYEVYLERMVSLLVRESNMVKKKRARASAS